MNIEQIQEYLDDATDDELLGVLSLVTKELQYRQQEVSPRGRFKNV